MKYTISEDNNNRLNFGDMDKSFFLVGLLNEFMNRFQAAGDRFFEEISWKQCFLIICIGFFETPPTIKDISEMMGSSHQNIKQILLKLQKLGFLKFVPDEKDKRKQRIILTNKTDKFNKKYEKASAEFINQLFQNVDKNDLDITIKTILQLDNQLKKMK